MPSKRATVVGEINHRSLHCRLANFRCLMIVVKCGAVIGRETRCLYVPTISRLDSFKPIAAPYLIKPPLRVSRDAEGLAKGQLAELRFWKIHQIVSIPVKQPELFKVLLSFPWSNRARGLFRSARVCEEVLKFCPLAEKRGSLEGVRERGFNHDHQTTEFRKRQCTLQ